MSLTLFYTAEKNQFSTSSRNFKSFADFTPDLNDATRGNRGFYRVRRGFSVLAEGRHIFGRHYKDLPETGNRARKVSGTQGRMTQTPFFDMKQNGQQKTCNLFCNIAARLVEKRVLPPTFKPVFQQFRLMQVAKSCCRKQRVVLFLATKSVHVLPAQGKLVLQEMT